MSGIRIHTFSGDRQCLDG